MIETLRLIQAVAIGMTVTVLSGCTAITHTNLGEGVPNAHIYFELLTSDFAGGGHLGVSTDATCKKSISVSDYVRVSDFTKGHHLRDDVDKFDAFCSRRKRDSALWSINGSPF